MKTIEDIIVEKEYRELTPEELKAVAELAENEQEFIEMKLLFTQLTADVLPEIQVEASEATKNSLDQIFMAKHPVIANEWKKEEAVAEETKTVALYNRTWVRAAAILILFGGVSYYFVVNNTEELMAPEAKLQAKNVVAPAEHNAKEDLGSSAVPTKTEEPVKQDKRIEDKAFVVPTLAMADVDTYANAESSKFLKKSEPIATPNFAGATSLTFGSGNTAYLGSTEYTFSASSPTVTANANYATPTTAAGYMGVITYTESTKDRAVNYGRLADLNPEMDMSKPATASGSGSVSTSEMLDWIQAAY